MTYRQAPLRARVLVVDGDVARATALARALGELGAEAIVFGDGEAAWRRFAELKPTSVLAALGGERGGAWLLRRVQTEFMGTPPSFYLLGDGGALDAVRGLEFDGFVLLPVARDALLGLTVPRTGGAESRAREAMRLRELFELSLLGGQLSRNLEALVARAALTFQADDCVVWHGAELTHATALPPEERLALAEACRLAAWIGGTLYIAPDLSGQLVTDVGGRAVVAVPLGNAPDAGLALVANPRRRFTNEERDALAVLARRLAGELAWMSAHERLVAENTRLRDAALLDPLTGVMNFTAFEQAVRAQLATTAGRERLAIAMIDVVGMRAINERFGHQVGDRVLGHVGRVVRAVVRAADPVGRIGGDELGVLLVGADADRGRAAAEQLLAALATTPFRDGELEIPIGAAAGVAAVAAHESSPEPVFGRARAALRRVRKVAGAIQVAHDDHEGEGAMLDGAELGLPSGSVLGGMYRILHELSRGAMGVVYRAEDLGLGRQIAIKLLRADLARDENLVARFRREAAMLAALRHRNLVQVYALGAEQGDVYFVMELVEGEPVSDALARLVAGGSAFAPHDVARVVEEIAEALEAIHALGIVHRDVKPANVLLDHVNDRAVLVDVGVARRREEAVDAAGTPGYAAPECFLDMVETPASDVYGLAATAYAMLTGRPPYEGGELAELVARQMNEAPWPPSSLVHGIPPAVDAVLVRALAGQPEQRFASAPLFAQALSRALAREPGARSGKLSLPAPAATPATAATIRPTLTVSAPPVVMSRAVFFKIGARLLERDLGAPFLEQLAARDEALGEALAPTTSSSAWLPIEHLDRLIGAAAEAGVDPDALSFRIGRAAMTATLARYLGADPATLSPTAVLKATETFWSKYHGWGSLAVQEGARGVLATVQPGPAPLVCQLVGGSLARTAELAGARGVEVHHGHGGGAGEAGAACVFELTWAG